MNWAFSCLRRIRSICYEKKRRWVDHLLDKCVANGSRYGWCRVMMDNQQMVRTHDDLSPQLGKQLRQTNITSEIIKRIKNDYEKNNIFRFSIQMFSSYVKMKYADIINPSQNSLNKLHREYHHFLDTIRSTLIIYYQLENRQIIGDHSFEKITLTNFIIDHLFINDEFLHTLIKLQKQVDKNTNELIQFNIDKLKPLPIQEYGVTPIFQLNNNTLQEFNLRQNSKVDRPYLCPIKIIKQITKAKTPNQKLKQIQILMKQIQVSIISFYSNYKIKKQTLHIDAQNLISILIYVIVQSTSSSLFSHLNLIKSFGNPYLQLATYNFSTLQASLQQIKNGKIKEKNQQDLLHSEKALWENLQSFFEQASNQQL